MSRRKVITVGTATPAERFWGPAPVLCLPQRSPLRARLRQRHRRVLADGEFALAALPHVAEGPAPAAAFDLELQPLAVAVLAALQAGDGFRGERVLSTVVSWSGKAGPYA